VSRDEYLFKAYDNKYVHSVHALILYYNFFLVAEKIKLKVLPVTFKLHITCENPSVTRFKDPTSAILTLKKCLQEAACDSVK
jgi:hypothetical protein